MDLELFRDSPSGDLAAISGSTASGPWSHYAFIPHPLTADSPALDAAAHRAVADARAALAALDATAARLPNPTIFRHAAIRIEAQATAALEGTYEPLVRVLGDDEASDRDQSFREVLNYLDVAETAFAWAEEGRPWSTSSLSELHRVLMAGTAHERDYWGIRPIQVVIGHREDAPATAPAIQAARFVPPPPGDALTAAVSDLLQWLQTDHVRTIDPVVAAAMGHYTFESLHPFHDGNGRIGRLLVVLHLHRLGVLSEPTISVSPWFEARRQRYYDALLGVSTVGDWSTWVTFFANGLAQSATDARDRMIALTDVQASLKDLLQQSPIRSANARLLIDFAVARPTFTVAQAASALGMKYQGTTRLISALVDLGILAEYGQRSYSRRFHAPLVLDILLRGAGGTGSLRE